MNISAKRIVLQSACDFHRVERFIEDVCEYHNITNEYFGNIILAVTDAVEIMFSIFQREHEMKLYLFFNKIPKGLRFRVQIKSNDLKEIDDEDILDKEIRGHKLGRELFIIRAVTDELEINKNARGISMTFYVTSINFEKSLERIELLKKYWNKEQKIIIK